jgi:hypothetical protein
MKLPAIVSDQIRTLDDLDFAKMLAESPANGKDYCTWYEWLVSNIDPEQNENEESKNEKLET